MMLKVYLSIQDYLSKSQMGGADPGDNRMLQGNYAPVEAVTDTSVQCSTGQLPEDFPLGGAYVRVGPNPRFMPKGGYHWFDGDGMAHVLKFNDDGTACYSNRLVQTSRLKQEEAAGRPVFMKIGEMRGWTGLFKMMLGSWASCMGIVDSSKGLGTANTALAYNASKILALNEADKPYVLRLACNGVLESMDMRLGLDGGADKMTAHPKSDPVTGDLVFFNYSLEKKPYATFGNLDSDGKLTKSFGIPGVKEPVMMHDFHITEHFAIFMDLPLCFKPKDMVKKNALPFEFDPAKKARYGLLRRDASDAEGMQWFELPAHFVFHVANAWEEEVKGELLVRMFVCKFNEISLAFAEKDAQPSKPILSEIVLNTVTGEASCLERTQVLGDFPVINPAYMGRKSRYAYQAIIDEETGFSFDGVAKMDLTSSAEDICVAEVRWGKHCLGGECNFVPKVKQASEDDGFLVTYVYNEDTETSECVVLDALTMAEEPVARFRMPQRVPFGFHGMWVTPDQVEAQKTAA